MNYGLCYMGSKSSFSDEIIEILPKKKHFYDLFHGGGAVTHSAILSKNYDVIIANDINPMIQSLLINSIKDLYNNRMEWVSRERFYSEKDSDEFIKYLWSFSAKGTQYLYAKEIEPLKKAVFYARNFNDVSLLAEMGIKTDGSSLDLLYNEKDYVNKYVKYYTKTFLKKELSLDDISHEVEKYEKLLTKESEKLRAYLVDGLRKANKRACDVDRFLGTNGMAGHYFGRSQWEFPTFDVYSKLKEFLNLPKEYNEIFGTNDFIQRIATLKQLKKINRVNRIDFNSRFRRVKELGKLDGNFDNILNFYLGDYRKVPIEKDSVIYCDIPYENTESYETDFNHAEFFDWCTKQSELVVISSYQMPKNRFTEVFKRPLNRGLGGGKIVYEKMFVPNHQIDLWNESNTLFLF